MKLATAFVEVRPDTKAFRRDLQESTEKDAKAVGATLGQALAGGAFLAGAKRATDAASQLQQAVGGTEAVFGEAQGAVEDFAKGAAESAGLSERAARELTSSLGGLLKGFGFTNQEAADLSITLSKLGADLAATFGGTPEEAVQALGAALRGETDPLERFGIALNQTAVNAKAMELGLATSASSVDANAKAQATLALITERSADAQGQFAREIDTAAGQAAVAAAKTENAAADLGENLLPIYTKISEVVGTVADAFGTLPEPVQTALIALGGIAALSGPVKIAGEAIGSLAVIARTQLSRGLDTAAKGAYDLSGNLGRVGAVSTGLTAGLGLLALAYVTVQSKQAEVRQGAKDLREEAEQTGDSLEVVAARSLATNVTESERARESLEALGLSYADVGKAVALSDGEFQAWRESLLETSVAMTGTDRAGSDLAGRVVQVRRELGEAESQSDATAEATTALGGAMGTTTPKIEDQAEALSDDEQAAKDAAEAVDLFRDAVEKVLAPLDREEAIDNFTQALQDEASAIEDRARAVEEARARVAFIRNDPNADKSDLIQAERDLAEAIAESSTTLEGNSEAALRNRDTLREIVDRGVEVIETARDQGASLEELQAIRKIEVDSLRTQLTEMGYTREEVDRYIGRIEAIPLTKTTVLDVDTAKADLKLKASLEYWQRLIDLNPLSVDVLIAERDVIRRSGNRGNAAGSPQVFDGVFSVGEAGPEIMRKDGSSLEVLAGGPTALSGFDGVGEDQLLTQREMAHLLRVLVVNTSPTDSLRNVAIRGAF